MKPAPFRLTARGALVWAGILLVVLGISIFDARARDSMRGLADRVAHIKLPPVGIGAIGDASHRKLGNLHWPQWRVGGSDSPDQAARRKWELARATQHAGTGARIRRFLEKAKRGEPFTVAAIGGSVSKGRGLTPPKNRSPPHLDRRLLGADTLYSSENLHVLVFDWLNSTFPHPENRFVNGAQGGVGAGYFAWCFKEHIYEDADLVLIELGINDLSRLDVIPKFEHLVRTLLQLESSPAIVNIETFTTLFPALLSSSALHGDVVAYYDVPSLSIRDILLPRILADPDAQLPRWFRTGADVTLGDDKVREWGGVPVDLMHISAKGHALAAGLVINYLSSQLATLVPSGWSRLAPWRLRTPRVYDIPSTSLTQSFTPEDLPEQRSPVCRSMNSGRLHNRISGTDHDPDPAEKRVRGLVLADSSKGWEYWAWAEKRYLVARVPGSIAHFDFVTSEGIEQERSDSESYPDPMDVYEPHKDRTAPYAFDDGSPDPPLESEDAEAVEARRWSLRRSRSRYSRAKRNMHEDGGTVAIGYQRSANYGLGSVFCWVDNEREHGRRLDGYWTIKERNMGIVDAVAIGLAPGKHRLSCELLADSRDPMGRKEFRLFAIMHD